MNAMPPKPKDNTLGAIYDRGLIGTYQDWCVILSSFESFGYVEIKKHVTCFVCLLPLHNLFK